MTHCSISSCPVTRFSGRQFGPADTLTTAVKDVPNVTLLLGNATAKPRQAVLLFDLNGRNDHSAYQNLMTMIETRSRVDVREQSGKAITDRKIRGLVNEIRGRFENPKDLTTDKELHNAVKKWVRKLKALPLVQPLDTSNVSP